MAKYDEKFLKLRNKMDYYFSQLNKILTWGREVLLFLSELDTADRSLLNKYLSIGVMELSYVKDEVKNNIIEIVNGVRKDYSVIYLAFMTYDSNHLPKEILVFDVNNRKYARIHSIDMEKLNVFKQFTKIHDFPNLELTVNYNIIWFNFRELSFYDRMELFKITTQVNLIHYVDAIDTIEQNILDDSKIYKLFVSKCIKKGYSETPFLFAEGLFSSIQKFTGIDDQIKDMERIGMIPMR